MFIPSKVYIILLLTLCSVFGGCLSSNSDDLIRLSYFLEQVENAGKGLQIEEKRKVGIIDLKSSERLIVMNGSYSGSISSSKNISEKLANEIRSNVKDESWSTFVILTRSSQVVAIKEISMDNLITSTEPIGNNAQIATQDNKYAILHCQPRKNETKNPSSEVWNSMCYTVLLGFE